MIAIGEAIKLGLGKDGGPRRLLIFDVATPESDQAIHVDKRHYEIRFIGETESSVEIAITRKAPRP
jgi:hypothetical protein